MNHFERNCINCNMNCIFQKALIEKWAKDIYRNFTKQEIH